MAGSFRCYRPKKDGSGQALEFAYFANKDDKYTPYSMMLSAAKQTGIGDDNNATFDWKSSIRVKLGEMDIGAFLSVIHHVQVKKAIFHASPKGGTKSIDLGINENGSLYTKISGFDENKNALGTYVIILSPEEVEILRALLSKAIVGFYGW